MPGENNISKHGTVTVRPNPRPNRDYVSSLQNEIVMRARPDGIDYPIVICVRYVPDRLICDASQTANYFNSLVGRNCSSLEELANVILDDFNNELIPRWISVQVSGQCDDVQLSAHCEDRQPLWDNPNLLQRAR